MNDHSVSAEIAEFFGVDRGHLPDLDALIDDPSCWIDSMDLAGTWVIRVPSPDPARLTLILSRAKAGTKLGRHAHDGRELVMVLAGGFREVGGRSARAGEIMISERGTSHEIVIDDDGDCICAIRMEFDVVPPVRPNHYGIRNVR